MSQDDRNYRINSGLPSEFTSNQSTKLCLVEANTAYLVGKWFKEPESSLNQTISLLPILKLSETRTLQSVYQSDTVVTALSTSVQSLLVVPYPQPEERLNIVVASTSCLVSGSPKQPCQSDWFLSSSQPVKKRFLYCLACASLTMTLLLWVGSQVKLGSDHAAPPVPATPQGSGRLAKGATNARLAPPLQQSGSIDPRELLKSTHKKQGPVKQNSPSSRRTTQLAKVPLPAKSRITSTAVPVPTRMKAERIYVPVYQSPPSQKQVVSQPQITDKASIPSASPLGATPSTYTLIGVFEFGDRSAALVDINHMTRRISIGEMLTPSGWKLTKVDGQKVVLQRGSKLRSIYVGQTF